MFGVWPTSRKVLAQRRGRQATLSKFRFGILNFHLINYMRFNPYQLCLYMYTMFLVRAHWRKDQRL